MHIALSPYSVFKLDSKYIILFLIASHLTLLKAHQRQGYVQYCLSGDFYVDNSSGNSVHLCRFYYNPRLTRMLTFPIKLADITFQRQTRVFLGNRALFT